MLNTYHLFIPKKVDYFHTESTLYFIIIIIYILYNIFNFYNFINYTLIGNIKNVLHIYAKICINYSILFLNFNIAYNSIC